MNWWICETVGFLFQQEFANLESEPDFDLIAEESLNPGITKPPREAIAAQFEANEPSRPAAAASSGTSDPIVYQFASDQQMRSFINALENDARANILLGTEGDAVRWTNGADQRHDSAAVRYGCSTGRR